MDAQEIKTGDRVTKGTDDYTVISSPVNDIFKALNDKGETVVLYVGEVMKFMTGEESIQVVREQTTMFTDTDYSG